MREVRRILVSHPQGQDAYNAAAEADILVTFSQLLSWRRLGFSTDIVFAPEDWRQPVAKLP